MNVCKACYDGFIKPLVGPEAEFWDYNGFEVYYCNNCDCLTVIVPGRDTVNA